MEWKTCTALLADLLKDIMAKFVSSILCARLRIYMYTAFDYTYTYITVRGTALTFMVKFNMQWHQSFRNRQHLSSMLCCDMSYLYSHVQSTWLILISTYTQLHCLVYTIHELKVVALAKGFL